MAQHVANVKHLYKQEPAMYSILNHFMYTPAPWNRCDVFGDMSCKLLVCSDYMKQ